MATVQNYPTTGYEKPKKKRSHREQSDERAKIEQKTRTTTLPHGQLALRFVTGEMHRPTRLPGPANRVRRHLQEQNVIEGRNCCNRNKMSLQGLVQLTTLITVWAAGTALLFYHGLACWYSSPLLSGHYFCMVLLVQLTTLITVWAAGTALHFYQGIILPAICCSTIHHILLCFDACSHTLPSILSYIAHHILFQHTVIYCFALIHSSIYCHPKDVVHGFS